LLLAVGDQVVGVDIERIQSFDAAMMTNLLYQRRTPSHRALPPAGPGGDFVMVPERSRRQGNRRRACVSELAGEPETWLFFRGGFPKT